MSEGDGMLPSAMPSTPDLSVVVVHYRGEEHLRECLESLRGAAGGVRLETILVDNGGSAGTDRVLRGYPEVRAVRAGGNVGFARGCRLGADAGRAPAVAFVNDDAAVEPDALEMLAGSLAAAPPDVSAVAGRLVDRTGRKNDFSDGFLTFDGHAFQEDSGRPLDQLRPTHPGEERLFACGGLMAVRRDEFFTSGGFDDDYFAYLEDVDFGWRQWIRGRRILSEPRAVARHRGGATGEALGLYPRGFLIEKNAYATAFKNFDAEHFRALMPAILGAFTGRIAEMLETRNPDARELRRDPYDVPRSVSGSNPWKRLFGISTAALPDPGDARISIDDPLTIAHMRALLWIHRNTERLAAKRRAVQDSRRRTDAEIFARFPLRIVPTYPGDERFDGAYFRELLGRAPVLVHSTLAEIFA